VIATARLEDDGSTEVKDELKGGWGTRAMSGAVTVCRKRQDVNLTKIHRQHDKEVPS
jgi:hypothetical protein